MASIAFADYEYNVMDARRLLQAHALMVEGSQGRKDLDISRVVES